MAYVHYFRGDFTHNLQFSAYGQSVIHFEDVKQLSNIEMNILTSYYSIAGYLVKSILHLSQKRCVKCDVSVGSKKPEFFSYAFDASKQTCYFL